ncbi:hypothetical protein Avbf_13498 [Armadillidium vulgare]|nr:hypothetical protein Avbf_13498 [Armadillidium vulgare]
MGVSIFFLTLALEALFVVSTPFPATDNGIRSREAFIDCDNKPLVARMEQAGIRFSCLSESTNKILDALSDPAANSIYDTESGKDYMKNDDSVAFLNCPEGFTYVPEKGECILAEVVSIDDSPEGLLKDQPEESENKDCPDGFTYNNKNGKCYPDSRIFPLNFNKDMIPANADEEIITRMKCERGTVYVPEIDLCLPIKNEGTPRPPKLESVEIAFVPHPTKGCPKGSVYSPEIDHCLKIQMPPVITDASNKPTAPVTYTYPSVGIDKLATEMETENTQRPVRDTAPHEDKDKKPDKRSASDPTQISLQPLTSEVIGWDMCKDGEVYVSEIDLCLKP